MVRDKHYKTRHAPGVMIPGTRLGLWIEEIGELSARETYKTHSHSSAI
jgi:hypothetical protein